MSLSKPYFTFPYYNYPYTYKDKFYYYTNKMVCIVLDVIGVGIYSRLFLKQSHLSNKAITEKNVNEIKDLIAVSNKKRNWHCKGLLINTIVIIPGIYGLFKYEIVQLPPDYYKFSLTATSILMLNSLYGIMAHTYNCLRYKRQYNIIDHGIRISRAIKAMKSEYSDMDFESLEINQSNIQKLIYEDMIQKKISWFVTSTKINNQFDDNQYIYLVCNSYYENLFFLFEIETTANDFLKELSKLNADNVDYLYYNPYQANDMRKSFITNRFSTKWVYGYYLQNNK